MIYLIEGDMEGVAFSAISFIPATGQIPTPLKYLNDAAELTFINYYNYFIFRIP